MVHGYASKVIDVAEDGSSLTVELPCDDAGDILAVSCCPTKTIMETYVSVVGPLEAEANQWPISRIQGKLPVSLSHIGSIKEAPLACCVYEITEILS